MPRSHVILGLSEALPCAEDPCLGWLRRSFLASEPAAPWTPGTGAGGDGEGAILLRKRGPDTRAYTAAIRRIRYKPRPVP